MNSTSTQNPLLLFSEFKAVGYFSGLMVTIAVIAGSVFKACLLMYL